MLHRMLVPLDGSAFAEKALPTAFHLARRDSAEVRLVMVLEPALRVTLTRGAPVLDPALDQELRREARRYLDVLLGRIGARDRARIHTELLEGGIHRDSGSPHPRGGSGPRRGRRNRARSSRQTACRRP